MGNNWTPYDNGNNKVLLWAPYSSSDSNETANRFVSEANINALGGVQGSGDVSCILVAIYTYQIFHESKVHTGLLQSSGNQMALGHSLQNIHGASNNSLTSVSEGVFALPASDYGGLGRGWRFYVNGTNGYDAYFYLVGYRR